MKKAIITGLNGTVAPVVGRQLQLDGYTITGWNRAVIPPDDLAAGEQFIRQEAPDWVLHLAMGSPNWAAMMARVCRELGSGFLFTSTVSVFANPQQAPLTPQLVPAATDDYGRYKIECEQQVYAANPEAIIARLGWQIGHAPGSNNMVDYLHKQMVENGRIVANRHWVPSCAFLEDSAVALDGLMNGKTPGLYHLEGNPGLNFYEIATRLNRWLAAGWEIEETAGRPFDNRMADDRVAMTPITQRLGNR